MQNSNYLSQQVVTYLGSKRRLLPYITSVIEHIKKEQNKDKLVTADLFSGSGVVSRLFKVYSEFVVANDLAKYANVLASCYLWNKNDDILAFVEERIRHWNEVVLYTPFPTGIIEELYAPKDEENITPRDRVFYTKENARRIDNYRRFFNDYGYDIQCLFLGPLLYKATKHANTAGKFNAFYKNKNTGIGQYGGTYQDDLNRIKGVITMEVPVLSAYPCNYRTYQEDANTLVRELDSFRDFDLVYVDPPYNHVSYNDVYFMLDLICDYKKPEQITPVLGKPAGSSRSRYNIRSEAKDTFADLVSNIQSKYILVSFSNAGFLTKEDIISVLEKIGTVYVIDVPYQKYAGGGRGKQQADSTRIVEHFYFARVHHGGPNGTFYSFPS